MLTRDEILQRSDIATETVLVPEWGGTVRVRGLTGKERDDWESSFVDRSGKKAKVRAENIRARLAVRCVVDQQGKQLFSDSDADTLGQKSAAALERIYKVAARFSGIGDSDIEDLEKNSGSGPSDDTGSV